MRGTSLIQITVCRLLSSFLLLLDRDLWTEILLNHPKSWIKILMKFKNLPSRGMPRDYWTTINHKLTISISLRSLGILNFLQGFQTHLILLKILPQLLPYLWWWNSKIGFSKALTESELMLKKAYLKSLSTS